MFDKLIVSENSDVKNRRNYFMVSSFAVGILFLAAVVFSIYAADFDLGNDSFEVSMVTAPPETVTEPAQPKPRINTAQSQSQNQLPTRRDIIARIDEPAEIPATISTVPNVGLTMPDGPFLIGTRDTENALPSGNGRIPSGSNTEPGIAVPSVPSEPEPASEPPTMKPVETKPPPIRSLGVITGRATYLPKPPYPAHAATINLQGKVDVQVMIDEKGKVISANAVSGHKLLRAVAESAAWKAKFDPTYLSKVPVKVTGVIVYNFSR